MGIFIVFVKRLISSLNKYILRGGAEGFLIIILAERIPGSSLLVLRRVPVCSCQADGTVLALWQYVLKINSASW